MTHRQARIHGLYWRSQINPPLDPEKFCKLNNHADGVHQHDDGLWWFYDESGADEFGGYTDREECLAALQAYGDGI